MPKSEKSRRALATTFSSTKNPTAAKTGVPWLELTAGLALCATTQIEQDEDSVRLGWLWVDSAATVHTIKDRHSHADHRTQTRIEFPTSGLDSYELITVIRKRATSDKLL
jgi:hypothetical protein